MLPVVILAGGLATRLRPITDKIPKALIEVAGVPFILRQLGYLKHQGVSKVVICTGHLGQMIEDLLSKKNHSLDLDISFSSDGDTLLGTGGAVKKAISMAGSKFFVMYGDSFLPIEFSNVERAWEQSSKSCLMTVLRNNGRWDRSNIVFRGGVITSYDKENIGLDMEYIDYGLSIFSEQIFERYRSFTKFDLSRVIADQIRIRDIAGCEVHERFYEIGSLSGLKDAEEYFLRVEGEWDMRRCISLK
jgi:MurNAc alpha-1-phosphate uridylyltransferase